jgi:hypothetical protein
LKLVGGWQNNRPAAIHKEFRFVENIFEELDAPGEWYYNQSKKLLYYYPRDLREIEMGTVELSHLKSVLCLKGSETTPLKNITLHHLTFTGTKRVFMEHHEPLLRSDWRLHRDGAILIEGTENCEVKRCNFFDLGGTAIMVSGYNKHAMISHNHIKNLGGSGVCFVGDTSAVRSPAFYYEQHIAYQKIDKKPGPKNNLFPADCTLDNNLIHDVGKIEKQATAIEISMAQNITVSHNTIYNTPRAGINIGDGTWGGHIIECNDVFNTVQETGDHGAFNSWGRDRFWDANRQYMDSITTVHPELITLDAQRTTIIRNNRFRCDHGWDIDLDDGSSNYHIYNNICLNGGIKLREGFYRTVENNIMINNSFHPHVWFKNSGDIFRKNIVTRNYYPIVVPNWGKEVDFNFFPDSVSIMAARNNATDKNSLFGLPEFTDATNGNYQLKSNALALKTGFKNFNNHNFGVTDKQLREKALAVEIPALVLPPSTATANNLAINWLDLLIKNIEGKEEKSAYGLSSASGVVVVAINTKETVVKSGLLEKDVIIAADDVAINNTFDLMTQYQLVNWTGKMRLSVIRNQQTLHLDILLK